MNAHHFLSENTQSISLLTDFYQLTMAYGFWKAGMDKTNGVYHMFFRSAPFNGEYCISCGLDKVIDFIESFSFDNSDIDYLASLVGNDGKALFEKDFLTYLKNLKFECDLDAAPEGTVMFPFEPLLRVTGPIIQCQILETPLLNLTNFQTLVATKASRVCTAAQGDTVLDFGARRAQGLDGALTASRAAYIGGCAGTSNVLAGKMYGIPVKGTIAHSWVMAFDSELQAFEVYADIMPNNCVFLVDTYSTIDGVKHAIEVGKKIEKKGFQFSGIRLDSGDLAYFSTVAREMLDEAGFTSVGIVASNDLDETIIQSLKIQNAKIDIWGVGTKLITAYNQPALNGVYKLSAIQKKDDSWEYKIKLSEQASKVSNPGVQQIRRYTKNGLYNADMIYDLNREITESAQLMIDPFDITRQKKIPENAVFEDLLVPIFRKGDLTYDRPSLDDIRKRVTDQKKKFDPSIFRLINPHEYPVGNEKSLNELRTRMIIEARGL